MFAIFEDGVMMEASPDRAQLEQNLQPGQEIRELPDNGEGDLSSLAYEAGCPWADEPADDGE